MLDEAITLAGRIDSIAKHVPRLALPLSAMGPHYLAEYYTGRSSKTLDEFFAWLTRWYPDGDYSRIQDAHLSLAALKHTIKANSPSPPIKYIDFPFWGASKLSLAIRRQLHKSSGLNVLDIGAGPGHLAVVTKYLGHNYVGLDAPLRANTPGTRQHIFDDLSNFFRAPRFTLKIEAGVPMGVPDKFSRVFCLMGTFCTIRTPAGDVIRPWNWEEWRFFLNDIFEHSAAADIELYFQINRGYLPPDVWEAIENVTSSVNRDSSVFIIDSSVRGKF